MGSGQGIIFQESSVWIDFSGWNLHEIIFQNGSF
uniref:Uncharacterized protein n=1 Tax=Siphoviridae sp. ct3z32 TaxID=2825327 RepID=A0A8S5VHM1_9CAUD|nr:MAG TPA: hypothetical protein [Siphoviridae sp. ct3z32]